MARANTTSQANNILYVASSNPGKQREFHSAAIGYGWEVIPVPEIETFPACIEDGGTFQENARKKVVHYARGNIGLLFADDSGLCVPALNGAPGVYSARFAGPKATDEKNNKKLLKELTNLGFKNNRAYFVCIIAVLREGEPIKTFEGRVEGQILEAPRGKKGFGYDPLFLYKPLGKTFAEISSKEKFLISHRGKAFRKLLSYLAIGS